MYPYHNEIKRRIANKELDSYEYVEKYPRIGQALVLTFNTKPYLRPIRPHRYTEYDEILKNHFNSQQ
jgi:hypothetical protein